ncbi:MAG: hypothetical protein U0636_10215 [Phycisphaerales bacterium]
MAILAGALASQWFMVTLRVRWDPVDVYATLCGGGITGGQLRTPPSMDSARSPVGLSGEWWNNVDFDGWWDWDLKIRTWKRFQSTSVEATFPQWNIALLTAVVSGLGFARKRRREQATGRCARCQHTLAGARVCPECGAVAVARAAAEPQTP